MGLSVSTNGLAGVNPGASGFWKIAGRDTLTFGSLLLLGVVCLGQVFAIGMIFWSRIHFGSHFDPRIYTDFQTIKSSQSVTTALHLEEAQRARDLARTPVHDQVALMLDRAREELEQARARQNESRIIEGQVEKQAQHWMQLSEESWKKGAFDEAIRQLQTATESATGYLPAIKTLASRFEEHGDFEQARFQWEKISGIALPDSPDMKDALDHLQRLTQNLPSSDQTPKGAAAPAASLLLSLVEVRQTDLPLQDLYDLRFNLRFTLGSRGTDPTVDIAQTKVEVIFYDQSFSAGGTLIPLKILSTTLQPRQAWATGGQQALSLNYTVPKGYLRKRIELFGSSYRFCGYVVRLFYRGQLQDSHAQPADLLGAFARAGLPLLKP